MDINALDKRVENIINKYVKYYYTDWKNYDRPKYMKYKADKEDCILIVRSCGTYLLSEKDIEEKESTKTIFEYFKTQERANYYRIDLHKNTIKLIHKAL